MSPPSAAALPYHEPGITTILVWTSFLLLLNCVNSILDSLIYCGLLGQVFLGILFGPPLASLLSPASQSTVVDLGYLGLILLVFEGGLSTSFSSLKANLLSAGVAATGIAAPIVLSYALMEIVGATPLQCFAAGAALCSTSLGTTFVVMGSSGLLKTRMGTVLTSAAMMDDVVGLVMVQVISNLGSSEFNAVTVVRPVLVSIGFAVVVPLAAWFVARPATLWINAIRQRSPNGRLNSLLAHQNSALVIHIAILVGLVTAATYAGTSNLLAAYIAGAAISWWDEEVPHLAATTRTANEPQAPSSSTAPSLAPTSIPIARTTGPKIFRYYLHQPASRILFPFFFASIGFSIPITRMFSASIVWRGIVYALLMTVAKLVCGAWLLRLPEWNVRIPKMSWLARVQMPHFWGRTTVGDGSRDEKTAPPPQQPQPAPNPTTATTTVTTTSTTTTSVSRAPPLSLYPASIVGCAMVSRGEIGFLISALAESKGVFTSDIFYIVTWAVLLCTIVGSLVVGVLVKRVRKLEDAKGGEAREEVLGIWGVK